MSSALLKEALNFVDQEESGSKRDKRRARHQGLSGQDRKNPYVIAKRRPKTKEAELKTPETESTIKKLLTLSKPTADKKIAEKIVKRAIKGKPLIERIAVKKDDGKSILFADDETDRQINTGEESS